MTLRHRGRDALVLGLLAALPLLAHLPALLDARLLGPGDGAALHYPERALVWDAFNHGEIPSWNPTIMGGMPLMAAYRCGAFHPLMLPLALLPRFVAFQVLVLTSLSLAGIFCYLYLRRLGAGRLGAYVSGLAFALGPYLVSHLDDTPTLVAAPTLPLLLLAAEAYARRPRAGRAAGLALAIALVGLAGSPAAVRAGAALLLGRLLAAHLLPGQAPPLWRTLLAVVCGLGLAAPQLLPTLLLATEAGRQATGLASLSGPGLPGATGLVLRYVSHSPAPSLALAALPLMLTETPVRVLGLALGLTAALQWGRGPLQAPGALALVFDLTLAVLAGLSLSAQWQARMTALGVRLRAYFLLACLASAAALSVSAAALGPLPQSLAAAVGILALSLILYFSLAASADPVRAGVFLLPLTASFLLQPQGREVWRDAPTRSMLEAGNATRETVDKAMGGRHAEPVLTLARDWPRGEEVDLAWAGLATLAGRTSANGYEPMAPTRLRVAFDGMGVGGTLPGAFFRSDPARLEALGVRWIQVPSSALVVAPDRFGLGETLDVTVEVARPRFFPTSVAAATELRLASLMSDAVSLRQGTPVARVVVRTASGRDLEDFLLAGRDTGEWAHDRPDVARQVAHDRPVVLESWRGPGAGFDGHLYEATLRLPGRYLVDGVRVERLDGPGRLVVNRMALYDSAANNVTAVSLVAGFVSDTTRIRETAALPAVRLFEVPGSVSPARVVERLRRLPDEASVLRLLRSSDTALEPEREALGVTSDVAGIELPAGARASRAQITLGRGPRLDIKAEGPGLLVVAQNWDRGWQARVDGAPAPVVRVDLVRIGVPLPAGFHTVALRHVAPGFLPGTAAASLAALALALRAPWRES